MSRVVVTHAVEDVQRWLNGKAARAAAIESGSGSDPAPTTSPRTGATTSPSLAENVSDLAAMGAMLSSPSPEVMAAMQEHGVVPPFTVYIEA